MLPKRYNITRLEKALRRLADELGGDDGAMLLIAAETLKKLWRLDREAATYVESVIAMRTHFTGEPPYVGWKGLGLALTETLDRLDPSDEQIEKEFKRFLKDETTL